MKTFSIWILALCLLLSPEALSQEVYRYRLTELFPHLAGQALHIQPTEQGYLMNTSLGIFLLSDDFQLHDSSWDFLSLGPQSSLKAFRLSFLQEIEQVTRLLAQGDQDWFIAAPGASELIPVGDPSMHGILLGEEEFLWSEADFPSLPMWRWGPKEGAFPFFPDKWVQLLDQERLLVTSLFGGDKIWEFHQGKWEPWRDIPSVSSSLALSALLAALAQGRQDQQWGLPQASLIFESPEQILFAEYSQGDIISSRPLKPMTLEAAKESFRQNEVQWEAHASYAAWISGLSLWQRYWENRKTQDPLDAVVLMELDQIEKRLLELRGAISGTGTVEMDWENGILTLIFTPDGLKQRLSSITLHVLGPQGWRTLQLSPKSEQSVDLPIKPFLVNVLLKDNDGGKTWSSYTPR